ncbi:unnamed protein product [Rotaria socialis]|uniref:NAD(P)(+)--arginine ADP-ribosyltransferase n=1 Tax=Rotaria socialis TaxID=392032 RepID=A0A817XTX8_9BILA|nr:unnamed protein product [Rotaria socialis]CAF4503847.1 unnamed protein product [Rotaria socialis]
MSYSSSKLVNSSTRIQWTWQSNRNSLDRSKSGSWNYYSDVENLMIEEAFQAAQLQIVFDNYYIDFKLNIQVMKTDVTKKNPVKRIVSEGEYTASRQSHYTCDAISHEHSFGGQYGWIPPFIKEARKCLKLQKNQLPSRDSSVVSTIVEKAAMGIIEEGKIVGQLNLARWMAKQLIEKKNKDAKEVWKCCAYLYSLESFLYKTLNETMRLVGINQHEEMWRSKVRTLGPFCLLLWDDPITKKATTEAEKITVYRGAKLTPTQIDSYRDICQQPEKYGSFQAFTSTSRKNDIGDHCPDWNVLFIMEITFAFTANIRQYSAFPEEEEELIFPGVCFTVERMDFDEIKRLHLIYLKLRQRFNKSALHEISTNQQRIVLDSDADRQAFYAARRTSVAAATIDTGHLDRSIYVRDYNIDE